jgi:DNA-binding transcriptional LysR family regulator
MTSLQFTKTTSPASFAFRPYCEQAEQMAALLRSRSINSAPTHELSSERDLLLLLEANIGVAVVPRRITVSETSTRLPINEFPLSRTVYLYAVAGRPRGGPATTFMKQLSSADWASYITRTECRAKRPPTLAHVRTPA